MTCPRCRQPSCENWRPTPKWYCGAFALVVVIAAAPSVIHLAIEWWV